MTAISGYLFEDRKDAGKQLADALATRHYQNPLILALPRGGVVVADKVAEALHLPMDVVIARKIGAPGHAEYGIGALSENSIPSFNPKVKDLFATESSEVKEVVHKESEELKRRVELYRQGDALPDLKGRSVILIDDGLATGVTAVAAATFLRTLNPLEIILAIPVGPQEPSQNVASHFDAIICLHALQNMRAVGLWYQDFSQVEDDEVLAILEKYH